MYGAKYSVAKDSEHNNRLHTDHIELLLESERLMAAGEAER